MRFTGAQILNFSAIGGVIAMMSAAAVTGHDINDPGIDTMTTAGIPTARPIDADRFLAVDHTNNRTCMLALHRADGYDVHRIEPSDKCDGVGATFAEARTWREDSTGTVTVTDYRGNVLMKLARSDGFAWDVIEPRTVQASLSAF